MRVAVLCAVFVLGVLLGAVIWPSRQAPARPPRADVPTYGNGAAATSDRPQRGPREVEAIATEAEAQLERSIVDPERWTSGAGTLTGTVRDSAGAPVAGCVITALPDGNPFGLGLGMRAARRRPHEDADFREVAQSAIEGELWRRRSRRTATTGPDGRFVLEGISDLGYKLHAFHEGYHVEPAVSKNSYAAGDIVDFVAQAVVDVRVEVRLPDGSLAPGAWLSWHGASRSWAEWCPWAPLDRVRLPVGHATLTVAAWKGRQQYHAEIETDLAAGARDTLVLQVEVRALRMLTARLVPPEGLAIPYVVELRARRLGGSEQVDARTLASDDLPLQGYSASAGTAAWQNVGRGRHLVAAFSGPRKLLAHAVVEVADGPLDVVLPMDDPREGPHVVVRVLADDGAPVRDHVSFCAFAGQWYVPTSAFPLAAGGWVLAIEREHELAGAGRIRASAGEYGSAEVAHDLRTPGPVTIRFAEPARLRLRVEGYDGSGFESRVMAVLAEEGVEHQALLDADGTASLVTQPGECRLRLAVTDGDKSWPILQQQVGLKSGASERTIRMPALHSLRLRAGPGWRWTDRVRLRCEDPAIGSLEREVQLEKDSVAVFDGLGAGTYTIAYGEKSIEVSVPRAEVTVE